MHGDRTMGGRRKRLNYEESCSGLQRPITCVGAYNHSIDTGTTNLQSSTELIVESLHRQSSIDPFARYYTCARSF